MNKSRRQTTGGFTLIELLVVIAIIGMLASIVLASVYNSRQAAVNSNNLVYIKHFEQALTSYYWYNNDYPGNFDFGGGNYTYYQNSTLNPVLIASGVISDAINNAAFPAYMYMHKCDVANPCTDFGGGFQNAVTSIFLPQCATGGDPTPDAMTVFLVPTPAQWAGKTFGGYPALCLYKK